MRHFIYKPISNLVIVNLTFWLLSFNFITANAQPFYVDPLNGSLQETIGTSPNKAFKTIEQAMNAIHMVNNNMNQDIVVYLRGGTYQLSKTLNFSAIDGGNNGFSVIYKSYKNEVPIISGGKSITGWQKVNGQQFYSAQVPLSDYPSYFRNIWVKGQRAFQASSHFITPHAMTYDDPNTTQVRDGYIVRASDIKDYTNIQDIRIFQCGIFKHVEQELKNIVSLTKFEKALVISQPAFFNWTNVYVYKSPNLLKIINAFEELDEPGEFYLNKSTRTVFYYPREGENMNKDTIIAPFVNILMTIQGSPNSHVSNLRFQGIRFQYGNLIQLEQKEFGRSQADLYADYTAIEGQVQLEYTDNISFSECRFEHFPSSGIYLPDNNTLTYINGNIFNDLTAAGILIGKNMKASEGVNKNIVITNNVVRSIGKDFFQASGIYANTSLNLTISHNDVADVAYFGINQRYSDTSTNYVGNTQILNNKVANYASASQYGFGLTDEVAGIYLFGTKQTIVSNNYVEYLGNYSITGAYRQDQGGKNIKWVNNVADCKPVQRSFSYYPSEQTNVTFDSNYANKAAIMFTPQEIGGFHLEDAAPQWSANASNIIQNAGLEQPYKHLLKDFGSNVYPVEPVPEIAPISWSSQLFEYLIQKRPPLTKNTNYWRLSGGNTGGISIENKHISISGGTYIFTGGIYGNEHIAMKILLTRGTSSSQYLGFKTFKNQTNAIPGYKVLFFQQNIAIQKYNFVTKKFVTLKSVANTSNIYNSEQLLEIISTDIGTGLQITIKIGGVTLIDILDSDPSNIADYGFLMVYPGSTGTTGIITLSDYQSY